MKETVSVLWPAKINWALNISGIRDDGYHLLETVFQSVSLYDRVTVSPAEGTEVTLSCDWPEVPCDGRNLAVRAAELFRERTGLRQGLHIHLEKQIPAAAGLAGGSADGAAVLAVLNQSLPEPLPQRELELLGLQLGADFPFCLRRGICLAGGIGEALTDLNELPPCWLVLCKPPVAVSTAQVFRAFDRLETVECRPNLSRMIRALWKMDLPLFCSWAGNVLEPVTRQFVPEVGLAVDALREEGAVLSQMSGSGPTVFGVFLEQERARAARNALNRQWPDWFCTVVQPVGRV